MPICVCALFCRGLRLETDMKPLLVLFDESILKISCGTKKTISVRCTKMRPFCMEGLIDCCYDYKM